MEERTRPASMMIPALTTYRIVELLATLTTSLLTIWPRRSSGATVRDKDPGERKHRAVINGGPHREGHVRAGYDLDAPRGPAALGDREGSMPQIGMLQLES